jgi:hypothetical protein
MEPLDRKNVTLTFEIRFALRPAEAPSTSRLENSWKAASLYVLLTLSKPPGWKILGKPLRSTSG